MQAHIRRLTTLMLITAVLIGALTTTDRAAAGGSVSPKAMLQAYYSQYINLRDYWSAYQMWIAPTQTYTDFANGYANTSYVTAYFGGYQATGVSTIEGSVPGILIGHHTDGTQVAYQGCYDVRFTPAESGMRQWLIAGAAFTQLTYIPTDQMILGGLMQIECSSYRKLENAEGYYNVQGLLSDYFEAVNNQNYAYAYNLWQSPVQTYNDFVLGWQDTAETVIFYGLYQYGGVLNATETGRIPVVLLGYHTDGSLVSYQGCIGVNFNANLARRWSLYTANLTLLPTGTVPTEAQITTALKAVCY